MYSFETLISKWMDIVHVKTSLKVPGMDEIKKKMDGETKIDNKIQQNTL